MTVTLDEKIAAIERAISKCKPRTQRSGRMMLSESALRQTSALEAVLADLRERGSEDACPLCGWGFQPTGPIYRVGAEAMRERAAKYVLERATLGTTGMIDGIDTSAAIRALPVE